ncbi:cell wall metabolism sensor histidine kinase WalK [Paenibacillus xylanexedens]|uniref:sensor histidine kinase n=1 Tax=Paenibacillus xylanexedens TaxID=528191 RepID=UPI001C8E416F|nr:HAMP domain-containing sensor histidine kinase [Paenibacillus xylanexedens]MBY0118603.1 HAMP domain-containing histidine kinase [Paenibacillus xylanexedens]
MLISLLISFVGSVGVNNMLIIAAAKISERFNWPSLLYIFPYVLTPIFIVIFTLIFLFSTRKIVRDLITLEQGLQFISEGNLDYRVPVNRQDELGRVASNINHMTEQLRLQMIKERELEKSKMDMITGISHDLRTPLTSIIGYIELLRTESFQDKAEYDRFIQNTYNKATHLKKLLDDLFEYTRLTSVDTQLDMKKVDLHQLLDQLLFEPLAQENSIHIVKEIGDAPIMAIVDSDKIARAIDNLLMNALKYSFKPGTIHIRMSMRHEHITIEVENKGMPLTIEQKDKLFDRFYKVDYSRSSEGIQTGSGLGLSIARNIAELHQGTLKLQHTHNIFTFQISLPSNNIQ